MGVAAIVHWEIKGRFRKRVVLANVLSFRFSFRGSIRTYPSSGFRSGGTPECTLVPISVPGEHPPKPPFWKPPFDLPVNSLRHHRKNSATGVMRRVSRDGGGYFGRVTKLRAQTL